MNSEDRAGLYITVIFHLLVIIVLLACQIGAVLRRDNTFVLDFTKQEEVEKQKAEENFKEEVSDKLDELLAAAAGVPIRNIAVDRSSTLKDDRNTDAEQLYKDAERLAQELKDGFILVYVGGPPRYLLACCVAVDIGKIDFLVELISRRGFDLLYGDRAVWESG